MEIICPVKKTVWGPINNRADLSRAILKSGQPFGVDWSGPASDYNPAYPSDKTLYQYMGWGPHQGIDLPVASGTEIYASHSGTVIKVSESLTAGLGIVLRSTDEMFCTVYWHNRENLVKAGQVVKRGELIAYSDNTGYSKGNHLHYEQKVWDGSQYKAIDPVPNFVFPIIMSEQEVKNLYVLAFYRLPEAGELAFWKGKSLNEFLKTAIKDRAQYLEANINE